MFSIFPRLARSAEFEITSPATPRYNCIAWSVQDSGRWWWPDEDKIYYWPENAPREQSLEAFVQAFSVEGFEVCEGPDLETGYQKIALYAKGDAPTHAARQLANGVWTSKLGQEVDISHGVYDLEGDAYGRVVKFLRRARRV